MDMPEPTPAHRKLALLAGTWTGDETCHPSPWNPELSHAKGRFEHAVALGGMHVVADYTQEKDGAVVYQGHAVYSYDAAAGEYVCAWYDAMAPLAQEFRGGFAGDVLTLRHHDAKFGHSRLAMDFGSHGDGRFGFRMEGSPDGETWAPFLEATYRRAEVAV